MRTEMSVMRVVQWLVMALALSLLVAHAVKWGAIEVDGTTLALLGLIAITPLLEYVRKIRLGEFEAEIQPKEVAEVQSKAAIELTTEPLPSTKAASFEDDLLDLVRSDPMLGLAKVRIEIERVLRAVYNHSVPNPQRRRSIAQMLTVIQKSVPLPEDLADTVRAVIGIAERAVHGESIRLEDAEAIAEIGARLVAGLQQFHIQRVLKPLETKKISRKEVEEWETARYSVTTIIPLRDEPKMNIRRLDQEGLDALLDGYGEYAEFLVRIERDG